MNKEKDKTKLVIQYLIQAIEKVSGIKKYDLVDYRKEIIGNNELQLKACIENLDYICVLMTAITELDHMPNLDQMIKSLQ